MTTNVILILKLITPSLKSVSGKYIQSIVCSSDVYGLSPVWQRLNSQQRLMILPSQLPPSSLGHTRQFEKSVSTLPPSPGKTQALSSGPGSPAEARIAFGCRAPLLPVLPLGLLFLRPQISCCSILMTGWCASSFVAQAWSWAAQLRLRILGLWSYCATASCLCFLRCILPESKFVGIWWAENPINCTFLIPFSLWNAGY